MFYSVKNVFNIFSDIFTDILPIYEALVDLSTRREKAFIQKFQNLKYKILTKKMLLLQIFLNFRQ